MNALFVNPQDYEPFLTRNGGRQPVFVNCKGFVMRLEQLGEMPVGELGASSMQKEMMRVDKIERMQIKH